MSTTIERSIEINASPATVWSILADHGAYPDWNPFMTKLTGDFAAGATLKVHIEPPSERPMTFKPTVLAVRPEHELRWLGHFILPGLIDGEHNLRIEPLPEGRISRFIQTERFSGVLVRPSKSMLAKTELGFEQMNASLKARAESLASARAEPAVDDETRPQYEAGLVRGEVERGAGDVLRRAELPAELA